MARPILRDPDAAREDQAKGVLRVAPTVYNHIRAVNERVESPISRISRSIGLYAKEPGRTKPVPGTAFGALFKGLQHEPVLYRDIVLVALFSGLHKSIVCAMSW